MRSYLGQLKNLSLFILIGLCGCARGPNPQDPYEHFNRNTFRLNDKIDNVIIKPLAQGYKAVAPYPVRRSIGNFFENLAETKNMGNDVLQGRAYWAFNDTWRLLINTTIGIGGLFDPASNIGLKKHTNNFGLTLDTWGYKNPAYVIVPVFGPSTDAGVIGLPIDIAMMPWLNYVNPNELRDSLYILQTVNIRAMFLDQEDLAAELAFDPYIFMRSAFLQNRLYLIKQNAEPPLANNVNTAEKNPPHEATVKGKKPLGDTPT